MRCPTIGELPPPPAGRTGWPWTSQGPPLPLTTEDGHPWPRVTVVTPSYNQGQYIEETFRSVLLQGYPDLEYIVLDGGSTDGTPAIIRKYEPWLAHWTSQPDGGQTEAVNAGWVRATGTVLAYINSDDVYLPGAIATAARAFSRAPDAGMFYGSAIVVDERGRVLRTWVGRQFNLEAMLTEGNIVPQPASFYSRGALQDVGYLSARWHMIMDYALSVDVGVRYPSICVPEMLARFRDHSESRSQTRFPLMARELIMFAGELDLEPHVRQRMLARIEYEWASSCLVPGRRDGASAARHLRRSLRHDHRYAVGRPVQTAYLLKEVALSYRQSRLAGPKADRRSSD